MDHFVEGVWETFRLTARRGGACSRARAGCTSSSSRGRSASCGGWPRPGSTRGPRGQRRLPVVPPLHAPAVRRDDDATSTSGSSAGRAATDDDGVRGLRDVAHDHGQAGRRHVRGAGRAGVRRADRAASTGSCRWRPSGRGHHRWAAATRSSPGSCEAWRTSRDVLAARRARARSWAPRRPRGAARSPTRPTARRPRRPRRSPGGAPSERPPARRYRMRNPATTSTMPAIAIAAADLGLAPEHLHRDRRAGLAVRSRAAAPLPRSGRCSRPAPGAPCSAGRDRARGARRRRSARRRPRSAPGSGVPSSATRLQALADQLGDPGGVRRAAGRLHHLADEEPGDRPARPVVLDGLGVRGDHRVDVARAATRRRRSGRARRRRAARRPACRPRGARSSSSRPTGRETRPVDDRREQRGDVRRAWTRPAMPASLQPGALSARACDPVTKFATSFAGTSAPPPAIASNAARHRRDPPRSPPRRRR